MSEVGNHFVKEGFWIDWEKGSVMGKTLTTSSQSGNVVIALLTITASIAAAQLWQLATFCFHQCRATGDPRDALFWQHQALLRTLPTPSALVADTIKLWWTWRHVKRSFIRSWSTVALACLFLLASVASGILASYIVTTSNLAVLVSSPSCAKLNLTQAPSTLWPSASSLIKSYTDDCYQTSSSLPTRCHNIFVRPNITISMSQGSCPWSSSMCSNASEPVITLQSGWLNANNHLGINLPPDQAIRFRKNTTCNILPLEGHYIIVNASYFQTNSPTPFWPQQRIVGLRYGSFQMPSSLHPNYTFKFPYDHRYLSGGYEIDSQIVLQRPPDGHPQIKPLPEMQRNDSDVVLIAIGLDNIMYVQPIDDLLFSAHRLLDFETPGSSRFYASDYPARVIGCAIQSQYCIHRKGQSEFCSAPSGNLSPDLSQEEFPGASKLQIATLELLAGFGFMNDISNAGGLGYVQAKGAVADGVGQGLPSDQWLKELLFAESFTYSGLQFMVSEFAIGASERDSNEDYTLPPSSLEEKELCTMIKMRKSGGFANINVFGLSFLLTLCAVITLINLFILRICIFMGKFRRSLGSRTGRWVQDGIFQLQRRAFEAHQQGSWRDLEQEIPLTKDAELLEELPIESKISRSVLDLVQLEKQPERVEKMSDDGVEKEVHECSDGEYVLTNGAEVSTKNSNQSIDGCNALVQKVDSGLNT